ncbi:hypothetical protein PQE66_gp014 [Bacillus phage PBC2]|uniref:Uncharacterized protein n=1 Tax=Bacillus phage PBC2 TaxID=1675029 RepID=A0A218KBR4_9CAUD|nr:hypothetical protein PQE66_gp014 [Bacillus phage PBC2]AKQ08329.1 hypothetical protein PBC2_014 [Bacillus phage PBC2]
MKIAHVYVCKEMEKYNWFEGSAIDSRYLSWDESIIIEFEDTEHLVEQLADYITQYADIPNNDFLEYTTNEIENNRFDYSQFEDDDNNKIDITEERPNGYLCDYTFTVTKVTQEIEYTF